MKRYCESCGRLIPKQGKWRWDYYATRQFCNLACQHASRPDVTRDYLVTDIGCWEWQGRMDANGYGKAYDPDAPEGKRVDWSHRVSYRHHRGAIPEGHDLDHTCQNTRCINPDHLDPVMKAEHALRTQRRLGKEARQGRAAELRSSGLTYLEIARTLGYGSKTSAADAVNAAIRKGLVDPRRIPRRQYALDIDDQWGMYGGLTPGERKQLKRGGAA